MNSKAKYGAVETNPKSHDDKIEGTVDFASLGRGVYEADRVRIMIDGRYAEITYFHVRDRAGRLFRVTGLPHFAGGLTARNYSKRLYHALNHYNLFVKGVFDVISTLS